MYDGTCFLCKWQIAKQKSVGKADEIRSKSRNQIMSFKFKKWHSHACKIERDQKLLTPFYLVRMAFTMTI